MFKKFLSNCFVAIALLFCPSLGQAANSAGALFTVCVANECGYVDIRGQWVIKPRFKAANPFDANGLAWVRSGEKIGRINMKGEWALEPFINQAGEFKDGLAWAESDKHGYGFLNTKGEWAIEPLFTWEMGYPDGFKDGLAMIGSNDRKMGYINTKGEWVVAPSFLWVRDFSSNGLAVAVQDYGQYGYVNKKGELVIKPIFRDAYDFNEYGLARVADAAEYISVKKDNKRIIKKREPGEHYQGTPFKMYGYINAKGEWVIPPTFMDLSDFSPNGLALASKGSLWGYINTKGEWAIKPFADDPPSDFNQYGLAKMSCGGGCSVCINTKGERIKQSYFTFIGDFVDALAMVETGGKWGIVNTKWEWVIQPIFEDIRDFSEGLAPAKDNSGKWGVINMKGEWVIQPAFDHIRKFVGGLAQAASKKGWAPSLQNRGLAYGFINTKGEWVIQPIFSHVHGDGFRPNGLVAISIEDEEGFWDEYVDKAGNSRLLLGYDQDAERAIHWEYEGDTKYLCNEGGERLLSIKFVCGTETVRNMKGEITWPEKSEAEIHTAGQTACLAAGIKSAFQ